MTPRLIQIERHSDFDESPWWCFVHCETETLMLTEFVTDRYNLDGYRCIRKRDISAVSEEFPRKDFIQRALRCKGIQSSSPNIELVDDIPIMLRQISSVYGIVTLHRELVCPTECEIGKLIETDDDTYVLDWITPNGEWKTDNRRFLFADVTRIDWGDEYSQALVIVNADRNGG